jgi:hypothetical protein
MVLTRRLKRRRHDDVHAIPKYQKPYANGHLSLPSFVNDDNHHHPADAKPLMYIKKKDDPRDLAHRDHFYSIMTKEVRTEEA